MTIPLKLRAVNPNDLEVISALLQDAAIKRDDMAWDKTGQRFAMVFNRFIHEKRRWFKRPSGERIHCGLHIEGVESVRMRGLDESEGGNILALLALHYSPQEEEPAATITMEFAGGGAVQIDVECVDAVMADMGEAWEAISRPDHQSN